MALQDLLTSTYFFAVLVLFLTMYGPRLSPRLPNSIRQLFNSQAFRALVMFLVIFSSNRELGLVMSLTIVIVFMVIMNILQTSHLLEKFSQENFDATPFEPENNYGPSPISCSTYDMQQADFVGQPFYPMSDRNNLLSGEPYYEPVMDYNDIAQDTQNAAVIMAESPVQNVVQKYKQMF